MIEANEVFYYHHSPEGESYLKDRHESLRITIQEMKHQILSSPEGQEMVAEKLAEAEDQYASTAHTLRLLKQKAATCSDDLDWWYAWLIEQFEGSQEYRGILKKKRSDVYKWRMMQNMDEDGLMPMDEPKRFNLEEIKQIPIDSLIPYEPSMRHGDRWVYRCPLHSEKSPSFTWYKSQNSWHCYGCGVGGSVIDLTMKMNNIDFVSACRQLTS